jgi:hypothetical protein
MANKTILVTVPVFSGNAGLTLILQAQGSGAVANGAGDLLTAGANGLFTAVVDDSITGWFDVSIRDGANVVWQGGKLYIEADVAGNYIVDDARLAAVATWGHSTRQLTSFGSLVANIWSHASRTLTTDGLSALAAAIYQLIIGSRVAVSSLPASSSNSTLLELINNADATISIQAATTSGARLVFSLGCISAETPQLEADTVGGLLTLQGETAANPTDAVITRVDADTVTVRIKARAMSVLPVRVHSYELRELAGDGSVVSRWEGEISLRRTAGKRIS